MENIIMQMIIDVGSVQEAATKYTNAQFKLWFLCHYFDITTVQELRKQYEAFAPFGFGRSTVYKYATQIGLIDESKKSEETNSTT